MDELVVKVPQEMRERLEEIATRTGRTLGQCLEHAVFEFIENWETHLRDMETMDDEADRPALMAVND